MKIRYRKDLKPYPLLQELARKITLNPDGSTSRPSDFSTMVDEEILLASIEFPKHVPEDIQKASVQRGIVEWLRSSDDTKPDTFLPALQKEFAKLNEGRLQNYVLLTSISIRPSEKDITYSFENFSITFFAQEFPSKYAERAEIEAARNVSLTDPTPTGYQRLEITVKSRTPTSAAENALEELDCFRAIMCLASNPDNQIIFNRRPGPLNRVTLGGAHTIHLDTGELAHKQYWVEPFLIPNDVFTGDPQIAAVAEIMQTIERHPWGKQLKKSLRMYVSAFDQPDASIALSLMWASFDLLTEGRGDAITLCSGLFKNPPLKKHELNTIKEIRNTRVHHSSTSNVTRGLCYRLQASYRTLFQYLALFEDNFASIEDALTYAKLPKNTEELARVKRLVCLAEKHTNATNTASNEHINQS